MAIVWAVKRFFDYLYGKRFVLQTDHKPLRAIFSPYAALPVLSATRMLHYAIFLSGFSYDIKYRRTNEHLNADFCSRFPTEKETKEYFDEPRTFQLNQLSILHVTAKEIAKETKRNRELSKLYRSIQNGEGKVNDRGEYTIHMGCILKGIRVVIPDTLKSRVLEELHADHFGIEKMKAIARLYCYWVGIDEDIKKLSNCRPCLNEANVNRKIFITVGK